MRETRIYTEQALAAGMQVQLEEQPSRHLSSVLRLRPNAPLRLFNGDGNEWQAYLLSNDSHQARVRVEQNLRSEPPAQLEITLILGISKGERMDFAIQKAVELGVSAILPIFSARSVVQLDGQRLARRQQHWQRAAVSACEQSGRCRVPQVSDASKLHAALNACCAGLKLLLHHRGSHRLQHDWPGRRAPQRGNRCRRSGRLSSRQTRAADPAHRNRAASGASGDANALGRFPLRRLNGSSRRQQTLQFIKIRDPGELPVNRRRPVQQR